MHFKQEIFGYSNLSTFHFTNKILRISEKCNQGKDEFKDQGKSLLKHNYSLARSLPYNKSHKIDYKEVEYLIIDHVFDSEPILKEEQKPMKLVLALREKSDKNDMSGHFDVRLLVDEEEEDQIMSMELTDRASDFRTEMLQELSK